ncbi:dienelactone hydrolase family protein [Cupriavidus pinatubonensis]|uniref:dienelactone hydrolase family protein n=1 Tax=Cupriavidus pinatubonensis TaxID=248026 RepID=UPI00112E6C98|nr:dienelactone hydrolase family protein [Cupriavidus pinatubonensis]TPQ33939.1 dienelactone hydrolase [Cupriavidus pinatubonensis]
MSHWNNMVTSHGWMNGWVAEPDDRPNGGVILVPDVFGVNSDMQAIAERFAIAGYLTVVPALFDKLEREVELGYGLESLRRGTALAQALGVEVAAELVACAVDAIGHAGAVALVGYGWGGTAALHAAQSLSTPCVSYFGPFDKIPGAGGNHPPMLLHYGVADGAFPAELVREYRDKVAGLEICSYQSGAAFDRPGDTDRHNAEDARLAFLRTQDFLRATIRQEND